MSDLVMLTLVLMLLTLAMAIIIKATLFTDNPLHDSILVGYIFMAATASFLVLLLGHRVEDWLVVSISGFCWLINLGGLFFHLKKMRVIKG